MLFPLYIYGYVFILLRSCINPDQCFQCGEMGHFASNCPEKKNDKEASSSKAAVADDGSRYDAAMSAHEPRRWGDMDM